METKIISKEVEVNPSLLGVLKLLDKSTRQVRINKLVVTGNGIERVSKLIQGYDDNRTFIKLFEGKDIGFTKILELSYIAKRVLVFIWDHLEVDEVGIDIISRKYCEETGASRQSLSTGLKELVDKGWLFRSFSPKYYWINLHLFFKGRMENVWTKYEEGIPI